MGDSMIASLLRPSFIEDEAFGTGKTETEKAKVGLFNTRHGIKDAVETGVNICEWLSYFDINKFFADEVGGQLETISKGLAVPAFINSFNGLRREVEHANQVDADHTMRIVNKALETTNNGSESVLFFERINLVPLAETTVNIFKGIFWGTLGFLDSYKFLKEVGKVENLNKVMADEKEGDLKTILYHRIQQKYLVIVQAATTVAMASIALLAIVFEIVFSPEIMLVATSTWLLLNFSSYFYKAAITHWEKNLPVGMV